MSTIKHQTRAGIGIEFQVEPHGAPWADVGGIYAFCKQTLQGYEALYVGRTNSFKNRLPNHERWEEARRRGATHVLAVVSHSEADRVKIEGILIIEWRPPLNDHGKYTR